METTYTLQLLMRFLINQQAKGYQDINTLIEIVKSDKMDTIRKKFTIITGLRECGLRSVEFQENNQREEIHVDYELMETAELKAYVQGKAQPFRCEVVAHKMDNGIMRFLIIHN